MIEKTSRPMGTGALISIRGDTAEEVNAEANRLRNSIDFMRSPYIQHLAVERDGKFEATVGYWGLD